LDNSEFRKNLCNYIEQYQKDSSTNLKDFKEKGSYEKKNSVLDKYTALSNKVIEEDIEDENEFNELTIIRKKSSKIKTEGKNNDNII